MKVDESMGDRSPDIFDTEKEGGSNEKIVEEKEKPEEEHDEKEQRTRTQTMIYGFCYLGK